MTERVDKDSLPLDKPRRTPGHPTKSHIVKTMVDGKERIIRFGEQGASTAGKPKEGESERMKAKRASFKARHAKNIAKGKSSAAYWADRVKWASGGPVELREMHAKYAEGGRVMRPGEGVPDPSLLNMQLYADTVSREMFPGERQNPQRDAARHMLASALAAQKTSPGIAEFLGKAHEFKEAPLRTAGYWLGLSQPRADYHTDVHNNALGVQLGLNKRGLRELLDSVEDAARRGTTKRQPGRASLEPDADTRYAEGGEVEVSTYDPARVDDIVNQIREGIYG